MVWLLENRRPITRACAGSGPCGASAATFRPVTPRAGHESRRALRFGNAETLCERCLRVGFRSQLP